MRIVQLSDPHFGTILPGVKEAAVRAIHDLKPDLILLTGDITQRARADEFLAARAFTQEMKPYPMIAVPGNHDIPLMNLWGRLVHPYSGFKRLFKDQLEKDHLFGDVQVLGLNSTSRWRHVQGDFNLERLKKRLQSNQTKAAIHIAAFHHPMDCRRPQDEKNLLKARNETIQIFNRFGMDLMVGGHIHDPYVTLSNVRYPETSRTMVIAVAGTCTSRRTRAGAPNSFNVIELETGADVRMTIERRDLDPAGKFNVVRTHPFRRHPDLGWRTFS